ncbi:MAG: hypothetical protein ACLPSW_27250 [Roseiarcus sp.]
MDLFVVPTVGFALLYAFIIVQPDRGDLIWIDVTRHPTAEWIGRQTTEALPWNEAPQNVIRDRDRVFGDIVGRRLQTMAQGTSKLRLVRSAECFPSCWVSHIYVESCDPMLDITTK